MKPWMILPIALLIAGGAKADFTSTFEDVGLTAPNSYFNAAPNGTDPASASTGFFVSGGNSFNNTYDPNNGWAGWSVSNQTNTNYVDANSTPDYGFQYTSVTGSGANGSATYAVANTYGLGDNGFHPAGSYINLAAGSSPVSVQVTNTEYDYIFMKYGDSFDLPFGPNDYLKLTIQGYSGLNGQGSAIGAEYDFTLGSGSSIVTTWDTLYLSQFAGSQSLVFGMESSVSNSIGILAPAEFALDNFMAGTPSVVPEPSSWLLCLSGVGFGSLALRRFRSRKSPY